MNCQTTSIEAASRILIRPSSRGNSENWNGFGAVLFPAVKSYHGIGIFSPLASVLCSMWQAHATVAISMNSEFSAAARPGHILRPYPKAGYLFKLGYSVNGSLYVGYSGRSHRSILKASGSGYSFASRVIAMKFAWTIEPFGMR